MPQINQLALVYQSQWFWLLLVLGVIYFAVGRGMVPRIEAVVDNRNARIQGDLAAADAARSAADAAEVHAHTADQDARATALAVTAQAKIEGAKAAEGRLAQADAAVSGKLAEAETRLNAARDEAMKSIEAVAAEAAADIVAKVSGATVAANEAAAAVRTVMAHG